MSASNDLQAKLKAGIEAARKGDRATARRLLQEVIRAQPRTEAAWMWLASTTDNVAERRACLSKALEINPNNSRAREALDRLSAGGAGQAGRPQTRARGQAPIISEIPQEKGFTIPWTLVGIILILLVSAGLGIAAITGGSQQAAPRPTQDVAALSITESPTPPPSATALPTAFGIVVDSLAGLPTLPPTFTPTPTDAPSATPLPSPTPFPLSAFTMLYTSITQFQSQPSLFQANGDGSATRTLGDEFADVAYALDGTKIAFIRLVNYAEGEPTGTFPELFVAAVNDLANARQITTLRAPNTSSPSWAPDNIQIVFSSDPNNGDAELFVITEDGNNIAAITDNDAQDIDPAWSPDGSTIAFASDLNSPGATEIFSMTPARENLRQLSDNVGSSYQPAWSWDSAYIVFASDRSGDSDIYLMEASGDGAFLLTVSDGQAEDRAPVFTSSGTMVVFVSNRQDERFQLYAVDLRGSQVQRLTNNAGDDQGVVFRPDIVFRLQP
ncbi:MAG: PD40 domain-containing protein [Chloroflexi bacterium]|nr:PD40 domain-containing protein [Chloroflexota bacterium]